MKNRVQSGGTITFTNSGTALVSGQAVRLGNCIGIASTAIANGATGEVAIEGVFTLPKLSGAVIAQGETVDWDASGANVDDNAMTPASGDLSNFGVAVAAAGNGVTTVIVKLLPGVGTLTP